MIHRAAVRRLSGLLAVVAALGLVAFPLALAGAQTTGAGVPVPALPEPPAGNIPLTYVAYAAGVAMTMAGSFGAVCGKLWGKIGRLEREAKRAMVEQAAAHATELAELRTSHDLLLAEANGRAQALTTRLDVALGRLDSAQDDRRKEAAVLLREQQTIMREVMTTCATMSAGMNLLGREQRELKAQVVELVRLTAEGNRLLLALEGK